jgi:hypothetical protein
MTFFWDVAPCSLVDIDRHFRGAYCLYHQGDALPEDSHFHTCRRENLKSHLGGFLFVHLSYIIKIFK